MNYMNNDELLQIYMQIDEQRQKNGFLTISELLKLMTNNNIILDPFSTLISSSVNIGCNNTFYNGVVLEIKNNGTINIGNDNIFYPNTLFLADSATIEAGNHNQFGDGGVSVKANTGQSKIVIGDNGRYMNGVQILGHSYLGSGSQVIGNITVQNCHLEEGESFVHPDPDLRGGVLKGYGLARNIRVEVGMVINGQGVFKQEDLQNQSFYHPKAKT